MTHILYENSLHELGKLIIRVDLTPSLTSYHAYLELFLLNFWVLTTQSRVIITYFKSQNHSFQESWFLHWRVIITLFVSLYYSIRESLLLYSLSHHYSFHESLLLYSWVFITLFVSHYYLIYELLLLYSGVIITLYKSY